MFDNNRFGLITGSKCSVLFPKRSAEKGQRTYAKQLANQMFFKFYDEKGTWQTEHGHLAESSGFEYYQQHFCKDAEYQPNFEMYMEFGGSADCIAQDWGVDFKCPTSLEAWLDYLHEGIDEQQYHQAQMYMFLYDRPEWHICAYLLETNRMSDNGLTYPVDHDKRMIITKVKKEEGWSDLLIERGETVIQMRNEFYTNLIQNFRS
jgi:hypothetical protein